MYRPDYAHAIEYAFSQLRIRLSPDLTYHNLWHTQCDVLPAVVRLGKISGIASEDLQLMQVAAAYHDIGFIRVSLGHELAGTRVVAQVLPRFGFYEPQIEQIIGMIMATRLPQSPRNLLEEVVADADLDVLGRPDFFPRSEALLQENIALGQRITRLQYLEQQYHFVKGHSYFTQAARNTRQGAKEKHLQLLRDQLEKHRNIEKAGLAKSN